MPKAERGSLKDIGKRIKMKGLQKLKFYCQICEKQCRDANGFKCHITSDNHLQQMKLFSSNATKMMDQYSQTFEKNFIATLRMRHSTSKVAANTVYQEMIQDKQHIHMNATIWTTLSDFVKYLGKTGQCIVEETDRGWYITYIERDIMKLIQNEQTQRRLDADISAEQEYHQRIEQQIRRAAAAANNTATGTGTSTTNTTTNTTTTTVPTKLQRQHSTTVTVTGNTDPHNETTIQLSLRTNTTNVKSLKKGIPSIQQTITTRKKSVFDDDDDDDENNEEEQEDVISHHHLPNEEPTTLETAISISSRVPTQKSSSNTTTTKGGSAANGKNHGGTNGNNNTKTNVNHTTHQSTNTTTHTDDPPWMYPNIMVRIINQTLADGKYYRQKGHVLQIDTNDPYVAQIQMHMDTQNDHVDHDDDHSTAKPQQPPAQRVVILQLDQEDCETVAPKHLYESVCIVRGPYAGRHGTVLTLDKPNYQATIELPVVVVEQQSNSSQQQQPQQPYQSQQPHQLNKVVTLENVDYDDFSKLYEPL